MEGMIYMVLAYYSYGYGYGYGKEHERQDGLIKRLKKSIYRFFKH